MTVTVKNIIPPKQAENTQTAQYTATNVKCLIDKFTATNNSATNETLSVNLVPSGGTAEDDNLIIPARTVMAGQVYDFPELVGQVLESGGFISTLASASSALTISASGRELS